MTQFWRPASPPSLVPLALRSLNLVPERLDTVVVAVAVSFPGVLSLGEDTVALLVIVPVGTAGVVVTVTVIVMFGASVPAAGFPPVRLHVTVPEALLQFQFVPVALTKVTPAGSVSTTLTAEASSGPPLWTPI